MEPIDIECIENQKENIQPIRSGRSAHQLAALFKPATTAASFNPIDLSQQRRQTHARFQRQIQLLQDALDSKPIDDPQDRSLADSLVLDPLDIYLRYIRWTIEAYPSGGTTGESNLIPLLEQVTRKFMNQERYRQDVRYLKCWIFYAESVRTSDRTSARTTQLILNFMIHKRIGTEHSQLYQEYFNQFLPLADRLRSNPDDCFKLEQVLKFGVSRTRQDEHVVGLLNQLEAVKAEMEVGGPEKGKTVPKKAPPRPTRTTTKRIKVFEDRDATQPDPAADDASPFSLITRWDNLGTVASNRRQNTLDASAWKGQKLPMNKLVATTSASAISPNAPSTRSSKLKVFEDQFPDEGVAQKKKDIAPNEPLARPEETPPRQNEEPDDGANEDGFDLLDDLLRSEIQSHRHAYRPDRQDDDACQVLVFDPLRFHSL